MPFGSHIARVFNANTVSLSAPAASGVFGLSNASGWIHIGETDNIQARLFELLEREGQLFGDRTPTDFSFELCPAPDRIARQNRLVQELEP